MRLLVQTAIFFFGTLLAAALLALGEPSGAAAPRHGDGSGASAHGTMLAEGTWQERTAQARPDR